MPSSPEMNSILTSTVAPPSVVDSFASLTTSGIHSEPFFLHPPTPNGLPPTSPTSSVNGLNPFGFYLNPMSGSGSQKAGKDGADGNTVSSRSSSGSRDKVQASKPVPGPRKSQRKPSGAKERHTSGSSVNSFSNTPGTPRTLYLRSI